MKKNILIAIVIYIGVVLVSVAPGYAVPTLGVATDTGEYAYNGNSAPTDAYIKYFCDTLMPASDGNEGFVLGTSGSSLTVFSKLNPYQNDIYIVASWAAGDVGFTFGGKDMIYDTGNAKFKSQINGYTDRPYSYLRLKDKATSTSYGWERILDYDSPFRCYWFYTAPVTFVDYEPGDYFFACARVVCGKAKYHSPKTSSAGGDGDTVPEPGSMALLGSGLLGLAALRRRKKRE